MNISIFKLSSLFPWKRNSGSYKGLEVKARSFLVKHLLYFANCDHRCSLFSEIHVP